LNEFWFLREEPARLGQEAAAQRRVVELTHKLEAARALVLHERGCVAAAE
jgi:alkylation response protein AidB-like acyl-CoA dehydrogenase